MKFVVIIVFISLLITACGNEKSAKGEILSINKMQNVMWDFLQAEAFSEFYIKKDSSKNVNIENAALQKKIFLLHKITKDDFYRSYEYYNRRGSDMRILMDSLSSKAERQRSSIMQKKFSPRNPA